MTAIAVLLSVLSPTHRQFGMCDIAVRVSTGTHTIYSVCIRYVNVMRAASLYVKQPMATVYAQLNDLVTVLVLYGTVADKLSKNSCLVRVVLREATWLILPVVICLSQRLSHACLSTCRIKAKPRMAH